MTNRRFFLFLLIVFEFGNSFAGTWTQKANLTGGPRDLAVGFSIGTKGYIGTGFNSGTATYYKDFWEWDPATNVWTQKADFGGGFRAGAVGFSIGEKGFIGTGLNQSGHQNDFWEWDLLTNMWTPRANFDSSARWIAVGFSIGNKGYIGTGSTNGGSIGVTQDFWEWDGDTTSANYNTWTQKSNFLGTARWEMVGFSIGTKGYVGTGADAGLNHYNDFWEWDQPTDTWTQKADFGGTQRQAAAGFAIGTSGFIGTGDDGLNRKDFWQWDGDTSSVTYNTWIQKADFGGAPRWEALGFSIGNRGYIGMGFFFSVSTDDFWEYCDTCSSNGISEPFDATQISFYPNPTNEFLVISSKVAVEEIEIFNTLGEKVLALPTSNLNEVKSASGGIQHQTSVDISALENGIYFLKLSSEKKSFTQKIIIQH